MNGELLDDAMPNQCHPALAGIADLVRPAFSQMRQIRIVVPHTPTASFRDDDDLSVSAVAHEETLNVRRCSGPAPWAYIPFVYDWYAATDRLGRSIGGSWVEMRARGSGDLRGARWAVELLPTYDEYARF